MEFKDYYKILGVDRNADQKAISQAFRRLARQHHPDVNKGKGAEDRFKEINEAYQALGEPKKRAQYDQIYDAYKSGVPWQDMFGRVAGQQTWAGPGGVTFSVGDLGEMDDLFGRAGGFSDFFQQLFGGLGGPGPMGPREARVESRVEITLEEAFRGTRRAITGPGRRRLDVEIPRGVRDGQTIRLPGAAGGRDAYLTVRVAPHGLFERADDDLIVEVPISVPEAVLGGEVEVPTLEGKITMTIPPETQTGQRFRLKELGMPHARGGGRGDQYVRVKVVTPTGVSRRERELFEELRRLRTDDPRARPQSVGDGHGDVV